MSAAQLDEVRNCGNCQHLAWLVALGLGPRCTHPENRGLPIIPSGYDPAGKALDLPIIPSRDFVCENHQRKGK
ncbi:hypothetical protein [Mesorhizobium sp. M0030]|uniref:hypothetical protein n=1 Tax=Mesorhizobium sp. M0030 TaxID=2956851 RepID=UPI00333867FD